MEQLEVTQNKRQNAWQQFQTTKGKTKKVHLGRFCIWYVAISKFWDQGLCLLLYVAICTSGPFIFIELHIPLSSEWSPNSHYYVQFHTLIPSHKFGGLSMYLIFCFSVYIVLFTLTFNSLLALSDWFLFGAQAGKHLQVSRRPTRQGWCDRKWKGFDRVPKKGKTLASQGSNRWWCGWIG